MFGKHHDQKITEGRVGGEHGSLLTDLTPEPARGGLRDVCQQNVVLSTALGLSYHSQSVSQSVTTTYINTESSLIMYCHGLHFSG